MGVISEFNKELSLWFNAHGITNLEFVEGEEFCYYPNEKVVQYGLLDDPDNDIYFQQFFMEYGIEYTCHTFVLSLLHEVGHYMTLHYFKDEDREQDKAAKESHASDKTIETNYWYWELPTEFAANMWALEWINNNIEDLRALHELCSKGLDSIYDDADVLQQILDWQAEVIETGERTPLIISEEN